jgi:thioredoxin reductase/2-polyprenyl-3-methyl-5-hydroxy-6-metoxy-1,4-benzoquinol methylase
MDERWDVIVVGAGAAGLSAALMLGRARRKVVVIDAGEPRNRFAAQMHGVLGHDGIDPAELLRRGREEIGRYDVEVRHGIVDRVDEMPGGISVHLHDDQALIGRALIVATGITDQLPNVPGLAERWGTSVLHCPYCHGWEVRGRRLGVLATSPLGLHQAQLVRQWSDDIVVFSAGLGPLDAADEQRLQARGIRLVSKPVIEVLGDGDEVTAVRTDDGRLVEVDAIFTAGSAAPHDEFLAHLDLERTESPLGSFLAVDETGKTSNDRIWAAGNVTNPSANVAICMSAGATAGGVVNMALITEEFDQAVAAHSHSWPDVAPASFWEERYTGSERVWSGRVNAVLADVAGTLAIGTALDLGCGEGADVIWLAQRGWRATGIDISPTAIDRAREAARAAGLSDDQVTFLTADLSELEKTGPYDLVTASFFHSPVELPRAEVLRRVSGLIPGGGHLLITSHAAAPPWADQSAHTHRFLTAEEEIEALALDIDVDWKVVLAETRSRTTSAPDGTPANLDDVVVLLRRR